MTPEFIGGSLDLRENIKMMSLLYSSFLILLSSMSACASNRSADNSSSVEAAIIKICVDETEKLIGESLLSDADRAYVYVFMNGYDVSFTRGAVGTFSTRSLGYKQILACGVSGDKVVFLGAPLKDALINKPELNTFENYEEAVTEFLYKKIISLSIAVLNHSMKRLRLSGQLLSKCLSISPPPSSSPTPSATAKPVPMMPNMASC